MVTFNLKVFVEEFSIARESGDLNSEQDLLNGFYNFFNQANGDVRRGVRNYLYNNEIAKQYTDLQDIATICKCNF